MFLPRGSIALTTADSSLLAFALATIGGLVAAALIRRAARAPSTDPATGRPRRGTRRRAGAVIVLGPIIGFLVAPTFRAHAWVAVLGGLGLALVGMYSDRASSDRRIVPAAIGIATVVAVAGGVRLGPTGVGVVDVLAAAAVIALVTAAANGLGNTDGLGAGVGAAGALGVLALAGFAGQSSLAAVAAGLLGACVAFLAFNLPPASLFIGTGGRLMIGYVLAVGALSVRLPVGPTGRVVVPLVLLGLLLLDAGIVVADRLVRRRSLFDPRRDHLVHRLVSRHWRPGEATLILVLAQLVLALVAVFTGRGVLAVWLGATIAVVVVAVVGAEAKRATLDAREAPGLSRRARLVVGAVVVGLLVATVPTAISAVDVRDSMEEGRREAARGLAAARDGDDVAAELAFRQAAGAFEQARDTLGSAVLEPGLLVPGLAPNLRAARTLADIGRDLATAGTDVTTAVDQERLAVVDGRLPLEELRVVTPALERGAQALDRALTRLRALDTPYLLSIVGDSLQKITRQLTQAAGEARRAAAAAQLAPAIFGGDEPRTYLLIVQHPGQLRATGGAIVNWALITAVDGDLSVGEMQTVTSWNAALQRLTPDPVREAPAAYTARFPLHPEVAMQEANVSPQFPAAAEALASLSPQAGLPEIDGVIAVDPVGLAALLELTGPVFVPGWPTEVSASNVLDITLHDQYVAFASDPEREDFLGDVAEVVVDEATSGSLGSPARIAQVLGRSAHAGHVSLWFARPEEQRLAEVLDVADELGPVRSDALGVYTQNAVGTKIDYFLDRRMEYRVRLFPGPDGTEAVVRATVEVHLDNTAPASGLPFRLIGPFREFAAGENRQWVNVVTPLDVVRGATIDDEGAVPTGSREAGRNIYSVYVDLPAQTSRTVTFELEGRVRLRRGDWYEIELDHQPALEDAPFQVGVEVADGWEIARAPGLVRRTDQQASGVVILDRNRRIRVKLAQDPPSSDLWARLEAGT